MAVSIDSTFSKHYMLLVIVLIFTLTGPVALGQDEGWYKSEMAYRVVPPYTMAYSVLQNDIVNLLLNAINTSIASNLANTLNCAALAFNSNLSQALDGSNMIRTTVDEKIMQLIQAISDWEEKIKQIEGDLSKTNIKIESTQKQVGLSEQGLEEKEKSLATAQAAVHAAEKALEDAMDCELKRRRRKRFLGGWLRPICSIFYQKGIDEAMQRLADADTQYENAKDQLDTYRDTLNDLKNEENDLKAQVADGIKEIDTFNSTLSQFKLQQIVVADISQKLKMVILHLDTIFGKSTVLYEVITRLLDFELLIKPLNAVYKEMVDNELVSDAAETSPIPAETITLIRTGLDKLTIILPNMPFNLNGTSSC